MRTNRTQKQKKHHSIRGFRRDEHKGLRHTSFNSLGAFKEPGTKSKHVPCKMRTRATSLDDAP